MPVPHFSLVLRLLIRERLPCRRKLAELVSHHILRYPDAVVDLAIVHLECESNEVWENGGTSGLGFDGRSLLAGLRADDWKTERRLEE